MTTKTLVCPKCDGHDFKLWQWPHPLIVHWVLNPGLAFNELAFGQRLPKVQAICQRCDAPLYDRSYVPCPHCTTMNAGRYWSKRNGFGNWLGYVCPACSQRIPCLWNVFSLLILALTSPLWYLPYRFHFRDRKPAPPLLPDSANVPIQRSAWIRMGVFFGAGMWLILSMLPAMYTFSQGQRFPTDKVMVGALIWGACGVAFAIFMRLVLGSRGKHG
jgi:hypothetical protein